MGKSELSTDDQIYEAYNQGGTVATIAEEFGVSAEHVFALVDQKNSDRADTDDAKTVQEAKAAEVSKKETDKLADKVKAPAGTPAEDEDDSSDERTD